MFYPLSLFGTFGMMIVPNIPQCFCISLLYKRRELTLNSWKKIFVWNTKDVEYMITGPILEEIFYRCLLTTTTLYALNDQKINYAEEISVLLSTAYFIFAHLYKEKLGWSWHSGMISICWVSCILGQQIIFEENNKSFRGQETWFLFIAGLYACYVIKRNLTSFFTPNPKGSFWQKLYLAAGDIFVFSVLFLDKLLFICEEGFLIPLTSNKCSKIVSLKTLQQTIPLHIMMNMFVRMIVKLTYNAENKKYFDFNPLKI